MILISIHPRFAEAILQGQKTVEFRRRWTKREASHLVIYATSPIKQIVAVAIIEEVIEDRPTNLWKLSQAQGGGVTRSELVNYFAGLKTGFGIRLGSVSSPRKPIDPFDRFEEFRAPQSFRFLTTDEAKRLRRMVR